MAKPMGFAVVQELLGDTPPDEVETDDRRIISFHELQGDAYTFIEALERKYEIDPKCRFFVYRSVDGIKPYRKLPS